MVLNAMVSPPLAGVDPQHRIQRAEADERGCQQNHPQPTPPADDAGRTQADQYQPDDDAQCTIDISQIRLHVRSEEHTSELQSRENLVCRLLLEKKKR